MERSYACTNCMKTFKVSSVTEPSGRNTRDKGDPDLSGLQTKLVHCGRLFSSDKICAPQRIFSKHRELACCCQGRMCALGLSWLAQACRKPLSGAHISSGIFFLAFLCPSAVGVENDWTACPNFFQT